MYETYYGFREKPFSLLPDPSFLFLGKRHRTALNMLEYGLLNQAGFIVISGDIGIGKTTLIRHVLDNIHPNVTVGLISNSHPSFGELLRWVLMAFNLSYEDTDRASLYRRFTDFLIDEYAKRRRTVLIIDEAQNLSLETLEELRMLSNINADKDQLLQMILIGQNQLLEKLRLPELEQFAQRVAVDYRLLPMDAEETRRYIQHRVAVAGRSEQPSLFSDAACLAVHHYSRGIPRLINLLCDTALVYGFADERTEIDADIIHDVAKDKASGGLLKLGPTDTASDTC